jgi:hypothetical protein
LEIPFHACWPWFFSFFYFSFDCMGFYEKNKS